MLKRFGLDRRDLQLLGGLLLFLAGLWLIYKPAALILGGILCSLHAYLTEAAEAREAKHGNPDA